MGRVFMLLRSVWDEPRPPQPPGRTWRDWALVGVLAAAAVIEGLVRPDFPWRVPSVAVALCLLPTLLWRRTNPLLMVAIVFVMSGLAPLLMDGEDISAYAIIYVLILPYSLLRWGSGREAIAGLAIMLVKVGVWAALGYLDLGSAIGSSAVLFGAFALGAAFRYRARARLREIDQIKLLERERLARDLHDIVAHHVSAIAIRAQAGIAVAPSQPAAAVNALEVIEAEASRALAQMRSMVRVLRRDEPAELAPVLQIGDLSQLATRPDVGPAVEVAISGDVGGLAPSVGTAIYHLAQESVTNARRHARHATHIEVCVEADATSVHLRVSDDGDPSSASSAGYGLMGMFERASLLGGTCQAGPNSGRGWTVAAVLPRLGPAV